MSSTSCAGSESSNALSHDLSETPRPHHVTSTEYVSDDEDDIIIVDSSDFSPRLSMKTTEVPYISDAEMSSQICGLARVRLFECP